MQIHVFDDHHAMSLEAAKDIFQLTMQTDEMLYCFPAGDTPTELLCQFTKLICDGNIDMKNKRFVSLDEWIGLGIHDEDSCMHYMIKNLYSKVNVPADHICLIDGTAEDQDAECRKVDTYITEYGPIDIAVLGIGMNGHLGLNEPDTSINANTHIVALDTVTKKIAPKYFKRPRDINKGITMGINQLMQAGKIILIASGAQKADIVKAALEGEVSNHVPASILQKHHNAHVYLDKSAAAYLKI
jgi:glucosamine-6-phosphate isomerase